MKGIFFTLDIALALFFLTLVFYSYGDGRQIHGVSLDIAPKLVGQDALNAMEKTGFLADVANGKKNQSDAVNFVRQLLPVNMVSNFSITVYNFQSNSFQQVLQLNGSTGSLSAPFATTQRVAFIPAKGDDYYVLAQLTVGFK